MNFLRVEVAHKLHKWHIKTTKVVCVTYSCNYGVFKLNSSEKNVSASLGFIGVAYDDHAAIETSAMK